MRYSLWMLFLALTVCALLASVYAAYLNDPAGELRAMGASYQSNEEMHIVGLGLAFDRTKIEKAVTAIGKLEDPCSISITGNNVTDADLLALHNATNISEILFW